MANASFCIIHRYWRWEEFLASERALQTGWIGSEICITQPISNVIYCIWLMVMGLFSLSVYSQLILHNWPLRAMLALKCYISVCLRLTRAWPLGNWKRSRLGTGSTRPLSKMITKPTFTFCQRFLEDTRLSTNAALTISLVVKVFRLLLSSSAVSRHLQDTSKS